MTTDTKFYGADKILRDLREEKAAMFSQVAHVTQFLEPIAGKAEELIDPVLSSSYLYDDTIKEIVRTNHTNKKVVPALNARHNAITDDECKSLECRFLAAYHHHITCGKVQVFSDQTNLNDKNAEKLLHRMKESVVKYGIKPMTLEEEQKLEAADITKPIKDADNQRAAAVSTHLCAVTAAKSLRNPWPITPR